LSRPGDGALGPIDIAPVRSRREREAFIGLPYSLHRRDQQWVPALRRDVRTLLSRRKNPFFEHAEAEYLLARRGSEVVGRIAAIHNRLHNECHGDDVGFFGFFECVDDAAVAGALFDAASAWLKPRGLGTLRGPTSFSTNDECGLLVDGFDTPPVLMMPHNPRYYPGLIESAGFTRVKDLLAYQRTADPLPARLVEGAQRLESRYGIRLRSLDIKRFDSEVACIKQLYNSAWERNWGFVPLTDHEIDHLAAQLRPVVVSDLGAFAEAGGKTIGFAVALPDLNQALKANPSGRLFPGVVKLLWASRRITRLRVMLLGTLPEWRGRGVDALLYKRIWEQGRAKGLRWAEAGWILEDNQPMRNGLMRMGFEVYKTYRLYDRPL
jgi:GNAT superfamily N-acetyltransferase